MSKEAQGQMSSIIEQEIYTQRDTFEDLVPTLLSEEDNQQANVYYFPYTSVSIDEVDLIFGL